MEKASPLVSICCQVYNHEKFLDQTMKGFQDQITNFNFEIIICDDASIDKSKEIIAGYAKLDSRIKPIFQKDNKFSKNERVLYKYIYPKCVGKYIAICDGDDYWTDPLKLQKQVDFLEKNVDFGIVGTKMLSYYLEDDKFIDWSHPKNKKEILDVNDLASGNFIFSSSVLMVNDFIIKDWWHKLPFCDWPKYLLQIGDRKIKILDENMGVYRIHSNSAFSSISKQNQIIKEVDCIRTLIVYSELSVSVKSILGNTLITKINQLKEESNKSIEGLNKNIHHAEIALGNSNDQMNYYFNKLKRIKKSFMYKTFVKIELFLRRL